MSDADAAERFDEMFYMFKRRAITEQLKADSRLMRDIAGWIQRQSRPVEKKPKTVEEAIDQMADMLGREFGR